MMNREFKYYPSDFGKLPVTVKHMDLHVDVYDEHTDVLSHLTVVAGKSLNRLELNAKQLAIHEVKATVPCTYEYQKEMDLLVLTFARTVPQGKKVIITTRTTCYPSRNVLMGLYYDETPPGCPPTQITQCQQWGFQKIVPCIDDMTAKCTYTTTITADKRYTNIISNGNPVGERKDLGRGRVQVCFDNTITPMAPYLFFLGCGTYDTFTREVEYPDGSSFRLELLVPPGSSREIAGKALDVLQDSILWIYLFTGRDALSNRKAAQEIWSLLTRKDKSLHQTIKEKAAGKHWGYKYTGTVYREIGMQNSDFGGMENVGNTTITTNRIMPFLDMTDAGLEYMFNVKVHEFYHNLNGSEVTGQSPFEIWLNEAVTVHIERQFFAFCFGEEYARLKDVIQLLAPGQGTLSIDAGAGSMPIEPDGFNDCNELITSVTYVKAPEFVRMVETLLGKETFNHGLALYHQRYHHGNATREQWIETMEEVSGKKLQGMAQGWLKQTGYPTLAVKHSYTPERDEFRIDLLQQGEKPWQFPFSLALFDKEGRNINEKTIWMRKKKEHYTFKGQPAFVSLNRGYTFYGKVQNGQSQRELLQQVRHDDDLINRFMAFYHLLDQEKQRLLHHPEVDVSETFLELYITLLSNRELMEQAGAQFLSIFESVENPRYAHHYKELYRVKRAIMKALALHYKGELLQLYREYSILKTSGTYLEQQSFNIKRRGVKNLCLGLLATLDTADIHHLIKKQLSSRSATDRVVSLSLSLNSSAPDKHDVLEKQRVIMSKNLVSWEIFLYIVGSSEDLELIRELEQSPSFRIEQANDQRGLYVSFANNRKKSLQTAEGRDFLQKTILRLAPINEYNTGRILPVLGAIDKMEQKYWIPLMGMIRDILDALDQEKTPSVYNTLQRILRATPKARKAYEKSRLV